MKFCQKCQQENADENQFCIGCGEAFTQVALDQVDTKKELQANLEATTVTKDSTTTTSSRTLAQKDFQANAQHYWKWLLSSWKEPSKVQPVANYYGLVTLILEALFFAIGIGHYVNLSGNYASNALSTLGSVLGQSSSTPENIMSMGNYLTLIIVCVLAALAMIGVTCIFYNNVSVTKVKFLAFSNQIAHYSGLLVLVNFVFMLFAYLCTNLASVALGVAFMLMLMLLIWTLAFLTPLMAIKEQGKFDRLYAALLVYGINSIIYWIAIAIESQQIGAIIKEIIPF